MTTDSNEIGKSVVSCMLLIFSIVVIMKFIFNGETKISSDQHPVFAFILIWAAVIWLSMVEGGQGALVGLPPVPMSLYAESHPTTHRCTSITNKGDNLDRYLMGRQFMVIFIAFTINMSGNPIAGSEIGFGLPDWLQNFIMGSGVAMILLTANIGQLNSQVNASHCMLDYINNNFALFTLYVTMVIEMSGLVHTCYLVRIIVAYLAGKPLESNEAPRTDMQNFFFWGRVFMSLIVLTGALAVTLKALFDGKTTMWEGVPGIIAVLLFVLFMSIVGLLEGMQIAFFAVKQLPKEEQKNANPMARKTVDCLFEGDGRNLPGFMIGRQICVTMCFFFIARVTSLNVDTSVGDNNVFGVPDALQEFFNTGLLGALITTILASISWQLVASAFPVAFLSNPIVYALLRFCLLLEATGICNAAWVLASIHKKIAGFQVDEVYIGTPEERMANGVKDTEYGNAKMVDEELQDGDIAEQGQHVEQPKVDNHIVTIVDARGDEKHKLNSKHRTTVSELLDMIGDGMLKTDDGFLIPSKSFILESGTYEWTPKNPFTTTANYVATSQEHATYVMKDLEAEATKQKDEEALIQLSDVTTSEENAAYVMKDLDAEATKQKDEEALIQLGDVTTSEENAAYAMKDLDAEATKQKEEEASIRGFV